LKTPETTIGTAWHTPGHQASAGKKIFLFIIGIYDTIYAMHASKNITWLLVVFCTLILLVPDTVQAGETKVTVSIAFCGAMGGFFFFLSYTTGLNPGWELASSNSALFNYEQREWQIKWPRPIIIMPEEHSRVSPYLNLIMVRF